MGKIIWHDINPNELNGDFLKKLTNWTEPFTFDIDAYDGYRSPEKQAELRAQYDKWVAAGKPVPVPAGMRSAIANRPYYSSHNWRVGFDGHPVGRKPEHYAVMHDTSYGAGLQPDDNTGEKWHFQDNRFMFSKVEKWLADIKNGIDPFPAIAIGGISFAFILILIAIYFVTRKK